MANTIQKESKIIYLQIGQNYENLGVQKQFDVSEWTAEFPDAHIYLLFKRPGEEAAAPVNTTLDEDGILTWTVSNWETGIIGIGFAEIRAIDSPTGLVKKSHVIPCSIEASVTDEDAAPDYPSWVDRMLQFGENVDSIYATLPHELEEGIASIQQEAQTQTEAIEQKGITTRASIPADYTTLSDDVTNLKSALSNAPFSGVEFTVNANKEHSSRYDLLTANVKAGEKYRIVRSGGGSLFAYAPDGAILGQVQDAGVASSDIGAFGIYVNNTSSEPVTVRMTLAQNPMGADVFDSVSGLSLMSDRVERFIHFGYTKSITASNFEQGGFTGTDGIEYSQVRIRLKSAIQVPKDTIITFPQNELYYIVWCLSSANLTTPDVIKSYGWNQYSELIIDTDCFVYIACATASTSAGSANIVPSDFTGIIGITEPNYTRNGLENASERIDEIERKTDGIEELYLSDFIRAASSATGFNTSTQRLSTLDCVALPFGHRTKLKIKINPNYVVGIRAGRIAQSLSSNKYWYRNGDTVTFTAHEQYYRIIIAKPSNSAATAYHDIELSELPNIDLHIYCSFDGGADRNVIDANADNLQYFVNSENVLSASSHGGTDTYPVLLHISDVHGDRKRTETALKIAEYIGADCSIISGDIVANAPIQGLQWMHDLFSNYDGLPIICTGNHDVDNSEYTDADVYNYMMSPSAEKIGNTNGTTYYYTDITSKKIRIIVTDIYQYGATTRSNAHMSTEQLTYICNALASTPAGYGVIIVVHTPCVNVSNLKDESYPTFFQSLRKYGFTHYDISGAPIYDIVDAFIARSTINKSYTQSGTPASITAVGDFTAVPTNVEFIAHVTGHIHEDSVCYLPTVQKQLMLNICCGNCMNGGQYYPYLADDCDITRLPYGKTQDAINIYVIDRTNKLVKITRIGGTKTYDMKARKYMEIPYADAT